MPVPMSFQPTQAAYLEELEARVAALENPGSPTLVYACTTANMPTASANINRILYNTTLNILAHSDGTNWRRQDTGAVI